MKHLYPNQVYDLNKIAERLEPDNPLIRKIVFSLNECYGREVLEAYIATYKPRRESLKEKASKLLHQLINLIVKAYNKIKR